MPIKHSSDWTSSQLIKHVSSFALLQHHPVQVEPFYFNLSNHSPWHCCALPWLGVSFDRCVGSLSVSTHSLCIAVDRALWPLKCLVSTYNNNKSLSCSMLECGWNNKNNSIEVVQRFRPFMRSCHLGKGNRPKTLLWPALPLTVEEEVNSQKLMMIMIHHRWCTVSVGVWTNKIRSQHATARPTTCAPLLCTTNL